MAEIGINGSTVVFSTASLGGSHFVVVLTDECDFTIGGRLVQSNGTLSDCEFFVSAANEAGIWARFRRIETAINPPGPRPHAKLRFDGTGGRCNPRFRSA